MDNTPFFLTNHKWYKYEERKTTDGVSFQRFELTNKATPEAIKSFKETMIAIGPDSAIDPKNLNRFQQALGYAARQHLLYEEHGLDDVAITDELRFISYAIRSYQLLTDDLITPNTLIFSHRISTLYRQFLKKHATHIDDSVLNAWIIAQDDKIKL
ncbi:substrate-binding protein [uncultured Leuconostoc sp.]|uniref:substrate-binding protein n=1 Tax=uncultured Leuconostoc sp. TaxID=173262 RepID=UPI0025F86236|nr:substrate-binding protein [uncultured Leuconostoc sp.]